jgi:hypothetical protein
MREFTFDEQITLEDIDPGETYNLLLNEFDESGLIEALIQEVSFTELTYNVPIGQKHGKDLVAEAGIN